jgi:hypothetical protein
MTSRFKKKINQLDKYALYLGDSPPKKTMYEEDENDPDRQVNYDHQEDATSAFCPPPPLPAYEILEDKVQDKPALLALLRRAYDAIAQHPEIDRYAWTETRTLLLTALPEVEAKLHPDQPEEVIKENNGHIFDLFHLMVGQPVMDGAVAMAKQNKEPPRLPNHGIRDLPPDGSESSTIPT